MAANGQRERPRAVALARGSRPAVLVPHRRVPVPEPFADAGRDELLRMVLAGAPKLNRSENDEFGSGSSISLMLSPRDLVTHGLLPVSWPTVVRSADRLMLRTLPLTGQTARDDSWRWVRG